MAPAGGRELPDTPTWAVAVVVLVHVLISVTLEHALHKLTHVRSTRRRTGRPAAAIIIIDSSLYLTAA
jgi:hypothetical protein